MVRCLLGRGTFCGPPLVRGNTIGQNPPIFQNQNVSKEKLEDEVALAAYL